MIINVNSFHMLYLYGYFHQDLLRSQAPVKASLQVLLELGEQLKQQVDTSAAASIQSDHQFLSQRLSSLDQTLSRQQAALQVQSLILDFGKLTTYVGVHFL